mgnify:FL=1
MRGSNDNIGKGENGVERCVRKVHVYDMLLAMSSDYV